MNQEAQDYLKTLLAQEPAAFTPTQVEWLQARRDYLSDDQKKKYAEILKRKVQPTAEEVKAEEKQEAKVEKRSYRNLQKRAAELGLSPVVGVKAEELEAFINTTEGPK